MRLKKLLDLSVPALFACIWIAGVVAAVTTDHSVGPDYEDCCDAVEAVIEYTGPSGEPVVTDATRIIIYDLAFDAAGEPVNLDALDVAIDEASGIGYAQGWGAALEYMRRRFCNE